MSQSPPEQEIEQLLKQLKTGAPFEREKAAEKLGNLHVKDERVIAALKLMVAAEQYQTCIDAAETALTKIDPNWTPLVPGEMPPVPASDIERQKESEPQKPLTRNEKIRDFLIGFAGWFVVNGPLWILWAPDLTPRPPYNIPRAIDMVCTLLFFNIATLIFLAFARRWIALGVLTALAANFILTLVFGTSANNWCGTTPFFIGFPR
jgi:hypothetical protein